MLSQVLSIIFTLLALFSTGITSIQYKSKPLCYWCYFQRTSEHAIIVFNSLIIDHIINSKLEELNACFAMHVKNFFQSAWRPID